MRKKPAGPTVATDPPFAASELILFNVMLDSMPTAPFDMEKMVLFLFQSALM
jgi:hypothetical protein